MPLLFGVVGAVGHYRPGVALGFRICIRGAPLAAPARVTTAKKCPICLRATRFETLRILLYRTSAPSIFIASIKLLAIRLNDFDNSAISSFPVTGNSLISEFPKLTLLA